MNLRGNSIGTDGRRRTTTTTTMTHFKSFQNRHTSLDRVLQRPLLFCLMYVEKYHTSTIFLVSYFSTVLQLVNKSRPHHGGQRLWPIPSPVPQRRPSRVHRHHPHTMGDDAYARLWCRPSVARAGADTPTIIGVPIFF
jgi:hypothetical protein